MKTKKYVALLTGLVMVGGLAATASASNFTWSGDGRVRAHNKSNYDMTDTASDPNAYFDQRFRFNADADAGAAKMHFMAEMSNGMFDGGANTGGVDVDVQEAFMVVPAGPATLTLGRQKANFGLNFFIADAVKDRLKVSMKAGAATVVAGWDKANETTDDNDSDEFILAASMSQDQTSGGALLVLEKDATVAPAGKGDGWKGSIFGKTMVNNIGLMGEFSYKNKKYGTGADQVDNQWGTVLAAQMAVNDKITATLAYAMTKDGYIADDDFMPTFFFGTKQSDTGAAEFGQGLSAAASDTKAIVLTMAFAVNEKVKMTGRLAYAALSPYTTGAFDGSLREADLQADVAVADGVSWVTKLGILSPDNDTSGATTLVDNATVASTGMHIKF